MGYGGKFSVMFLEEGKNIVNTISEDAHYLNVLSGQMDKIDKFYNMIEDSRAIHFYGKGRSGNAAVAMALRLKHFGYNVWFGGDVIKEKIISNDSVVVYSGSGMTAEVANFAEQGKKAGAKVVVITSFEDSTLAKIADLVFYLPGGMEKSKGWEYVESQLSSSNLYGGGLFELFAYLFQETLVNAIGRYKGIEPGIVAKEHERDEIIR